MNGKKKCKILKEIRRRIAEENDIAYVTSECKHQGNCLGTCPKCEAEVRYLEEQLAARKRAGRAVALAGLALTVTTASASCIPEAVPQKNETTSIEETTTVQDTTIASVTTDIGELGGVDMPPLMGDVAIEEMGEVAIPELEILFSYSGTERDEYISTFHRENVRAAWGEDLQSEHEAVDYFELLYNGTYYLAIVSYAASGMAQSIVMSSFDDFMGEVEPPMEEEVPTAQDAAQEPQ